MLDNLQFKIRQRWAEPGSTAPFEYLVDRWFCKPGNSVSASGVTLTVPLSQVVLNEDLGPAITSFSVNAPTGISVLYGHWTGAVDKLPDFTPGVNQAGLTWGSTATLAGLSNLIVSLVPAGTVDVTHVEQVINGVVQPPVSYADDKRRCRRVYQCFDAQTLANVDRSFGRANAPTVVINFPLYQQLRGHDGPGVGTIRHYWPDTFDCYAYGLAKHSNGQLYTKSHKFVGSDLTRTCHHDTFLQFQFSNVAGGAQIFETNSPIIWRPYEAPIPPANAWWIAFENEVTWI